MMGKRKNAGNQKIYQSDTQTAKPVALLVCICAMACLLMPTVIAQTPLDLKLEGKEHLDEIMQVVKGHYSELSRQGKERNPGEAKLKHWMRWAWYMSGRLGPDGEFVNITDHLYRAHKQLNSMPAYRNSNSEWSITGPVESSYGNGFNGINGLGRVDRIAFHPSNGNTIYIGTPSGGLWRTTDGGNSWTPLTDFLPSVGISGIVVSHANPNVVYVLTGDGDANLGGGFVKDFGYLRPSAGVFKSTDGGNTWHPTDPVTWGTYYGYRLVQDPNDANVLFAATNVGLYRTVNGGDSWEESMSGRHWDVEFKPGSSDRVYASGYGKIIYSSNGGDDWNVAQLDSSINPWGRVELAVTPAADTWVYAIAGPRIDSTTFNGVFLSTNNGENFTQSTNTPNILSGSTDGNGDNDQSKYDLGICASPTNPNTIITGGIIIWKSTSSGQEGTFENLTTFTEESGSSWFVHPDIHDVAFNPITGKLFAAGDGGIYVSDDEGESWTDISTGVATTQSYHMAGVSTDVNRILIGNQDNGVKLRTNNTTDFPHISSGDGFAGAFVPSDPSRFYATINTGVRRYWNNGTASMGIAPSHESWFKTVAAHTTDPNTVFVGSADTIFRSSNEGNDWTPLPVSGIWSIATCPSNGNRIYAAGGSWFGNDSDGVVSRSDNNGDSWTTISTNPGFPTDYDKVTDVAVEPDNSLHIWATIGGFIEGVKVFYSSDAGNNWIDMSGTLPNVPINCIAIDNDGSAYAGSDIGVFYRSPDMDDWIPFSNHLPAVPVTDIFVYNFIVRASTFGRGVWESIKPGTCSISQSIAGTLEGDQYYEASSIITSTANVTGGAGTKVAFKAGNYARLDPGFTITKHNQLKVYVGDCLSGGVPDFD